MNHPAMPSTGIRGFAWSLDPLERKLTWERDAARARLAQALQTWRQARCELRALEDSCARQAEAAAAAMRQALRPLAHIQSLHYLAGLQSRASEAAVRWRAQEDAVGNARTECAIRERKLQTLLAVRRDALRAHLRQVAAREAREADLAWLVRPQAQPAMGEPGT